MERGNLVKVKKGVFDPDYEEFDMSGWTGLIDDIYLNDKDEEIIISVYWDAKTLKNLPSEFIKKSIREGYSFSEMNLAKSELILLPGEKTKLFELERENAINSIHRDSPDFYVDEEDEYLFELLSTENIEVNLQNLETYRRYLEKYLQIPVDLTGVEDFSWEERFLFGYGSEREYAKLRKDNASYQDNFRLIKIKQVKQGDVDLSVMVRRKEDNKIFELPFSNLKSVDEDSPNYDLLNNFSSWIVNY